ncbi:hypothetical protein P3G55_21460 [Leptospira sp. 96542]|nr:hypothetical protein [Leptospira sp. 96542]
MFTLKGRPDYFGGREFFRSIAVALLCFYGYAMATAQTVEREHRIFFVKASGVDQPMKVTTQLKSTDSKTVSICGRRFLLNGVAEDRVRSFECSGAGTYIDGTGSGEFEWGYAIDNDGNSLRAQSYQDWGEPIFPSSQEYATLIFYRFITGPLAGRSYGTVVGKVPGSAALYMSRNYISP